MRMGKKKQPTYRVVAADSRSPRDGRFIEVVGTYAPRSEPSEVKIDNAKAIAWLVEGAQPTETVRKLLVISGAWGEYRSEHPEKVVAKRPARAKASTGPAKKSAAKKAPAKKAPAKVAAATPTGDDTTGEA